jgi:hypothetical protein
MDKQCVFFSDSFPRSLSGVLYIISVLMGFPYGWGGNDFRFYEHIKRMRVDPSYQSVNVSERSYVFVFQIIATHAISFL